VIFVILSTDKIKYSFIVLIVCQTRIWKQLSLFLYVYVQRTTNLVDCIPNFQLYIVKRITNFLICIPINLGLIFTYIFGLWCLKAFHQPISYPSRIARDNGNVILPFFFVYSIWNMEKENKTNIWSSKILEKCHHKSLNSTSLVALHHICITLKPTMKSFSSLGRPVTLKTLRILIRDNKCLFL
jgi:hypothetical protein